MHVIFKTQLPKQIGKKYINVKSNFFILRLYYSLQLDGSKAKCLEDSKIVVDVNLALEWIIILSIHTYRGVIVVLSPM